MAQKTRNTIKTYFETGKVPSQEQYVDLIDSNLSIIDHNTGSIVISGSVEVSGSGIFNQSKIGTSVSTTNASFLNKSLNIKDEEVALSQTTAGATALNATENNNIYFNISGSTKMFLSGSGNIGIGTTNTPEILTVEGAISASTIIAGKVQAKGSDVTLESGHISMSGDIVMTGSISSSGNIKADTYYTSEKQAITYHPSTDSLLFGNTDQGATFQSAITASNISASNIISSSEIHTSKISIVKGSPAGGPYGGTINLGAGRAFEFQIIGIDVLAAKAAGKVTKANPTFIKMNDIRSTDVVIVNCYTDLLSVNVMGQSSSQAIATPGFWLTIGNESSDDFTATSASFTGVIL